MGRPFIGSAKAFHQYGTIAWAIFAFTALSCRDQPKQVVSDPSHYTPTQLFADITASSGVQFVHDPGPVGTYFMPQSMGSGAAVFDFDGDGLLDIYLLNLAGPNSKSTNRLFRQFPAGSFQDVSAGSGLDIPGFNHGVAVADVNNDGKPDLLVTQYGGMKLFLNLGGGKFADITGDSGLTNLGWGTSAAFLDFDRDGWLDLIAVNYLDYDPNVKCRSPEGVLDFCGPNSFKGTFSKLYRNLGAALPIGQKPVAKFEDVSLASGIGRLRGPGLGVTIADFNGDKWPDIFIANDGQPNRLWINQKNGEFRDESLSRGVAFTGMGKAYAGMGIALGDTNNDGLLDLYVTHLGSEMNNLWRQGPKGQFRDRTMEAGLSNTKWRGTGFGTLMADFNCDGHLDIAVVNGKVFRGGHARNTKLGFWETYAEKNQIFMNDCTGKFHDATAENPAFCDYWNVGRGFVCADFNNDGAPDLLVTSIGGPARIFQNVLPHRGHWLKIQAYDPVRKRDAYGAEIRVKAGDRAWLRLVNPAESYLCSGPPIAHFGLGNVEEIDSIRVTWPDGTAIETEEFPGGKTNRTIVLTRGEGLKP